MYRFVKETIKNNQIAFLAAVFYMMMPYHLIDSFIRDAFAEILVFTFLPIIMLGINYLFQKNWRGFYLYFILGYVGLIESHLVMAVYVTIFLGISILILYKKFFHKDIVIRFLIAVVIVTCINLPFLITMMEHKLYGNYAVFQEGFMSTIEIIKDNLFGLKELLSIVVTNNNMYFQILPPCVILCILFCLKYNKIKNEENNWVLNVSLIFTFLSIFMISKSCPWGIFPKILLLIQFPWRLETLLCFGISILSACSLLLFKPENRKKVIILSLVFCGLTLGYVYNLTNFKKYDINEINISEMGTAIYEYLPMSMYQNMDYYWNRTNDVIIKNGKAKVSLLKENFPDLKFTVSGEATLEVPRIYYLGYEVKMKTENSEKIIPYYENSKGFMEFKVKEKSNIEIKYVGTKLSNISKIISIITSILFIIYLILSKVFSIVKINKTIKQN